MKRISAACRATPFLLIAEPAQFASAVAEPRLPGAVAGGEHKFVPHAHGRTVPAA
jgi:hypothetical protein